MGWLDFRGLAGRAALATCLLLSTPASADPTLGSLLKYLPAPQSGRDIGGAALAFVYSRLDLLAGSPEPSVSPGQARRPALSVSVPVAAGFAGLMQGPTDGWPAKVGFDLDAIDAMLVGLGSDTPALNPKIFAGAPRLRDATVVGRTLEARGATRATVAGAPV